MKKVLKIFLILNLMSHAYAMETAFYVLRGDSPTDIQAQQQWLDTLKNNTSSVNLIISQAYQIDSHGTVSKGVNQEVYKFAKEHNINFMALVTNKDYDPSVVNTFLNNNTAITAAINTLLEACKTQKLYGIQVDFEDIPMRDRDAFTHFYTQLSNTLHKNGFKVSTTLFPIISNPPATAVLKRLYDDWGAAYDYKSLGNVSDFVTLMAYDQSTDGTTPGPVAGGPWVISVVKYTLNYIPASKILLGIPAYSYYWHMAYIDGRNEVETLSLSYAGVQNLLAENQQTLQWEAAEKIPYTFYFKNQFGEYIFAENAQSFQEKLAIIKEFNLRGFSLWRLGLEDPAIWQVLKNIGW